VKDAGSLAPNQGQWEDVMMGFMPLGGWSMLLWVAVIGLVIWGAIALTRRSSDRHDAGKPTALEIARERYARGEISQEEFDQIEKTLSELP
jgi:putative membrane protein